MKSYLKILLLLFLFNLAQPAKSGDAMVKSIFPVTFSGSLNFGAISDGRKVIVSWNKTGGDNFDTYTIERSKDGVNFVSAMVIKGAGKNNHPIDYTDIDYTPFEGISYYRLIQTDISGVSYVSETVMVNYEVTKEGFIAPCTHVIPGEAELEEVKNKQILVVLKNLKGEEYISRIRISCDAKHLYIKDSSNFLSKGKYMVVASSYNRLCCQTLQVK